MDTNELPMRYLKNTTDTEASRTAPLGDTTVLSALRAASITNEVREGIVMLAVVLSPPGVAGAIVPCVRRTLLVVKFHPGDQVEKPEISTFIFHHPAPFGHIDGGI